MDESFLRFVTRLAIAIWKSPEHRLVFARLCSLWMTLVFMSQATQPFLAALFAAIFDRIAGLT